MNGYEHMITGYIKQSVFAATEISLVMTNLIFL